MGRPTENPAVHQIKVRLTDSEVKQLEHCCELTDKSKSDVVRLGIKLVEEQYKK